MNSKKKFDDNLQKYVKLLCYDMNKAHLYPSSFSALSWVLQIN